MQANLVSSIACSSSTMCARSLESWEHSYVHQRWCFYQSLLAWEFEFGQISLTKLDLAHWVFLAIIKELHEHRFGSHFVNDFPWFPNQIDPIMKQPVHDSQSPRQEQITPNFTKMNTNFVCNVYGKLFSAKDTSNAKIFDRFPRILDIYFVSALSLSQWPELVFKHNNFSPKSWWGSPFSLKDECHQS